MYGNLILAARGTMYPSSQTQWPRRSAGLDSRWCHTPATTHKLDNGPGLGAGIATHVLLSRVMSVDVHVRASPRSSTSLDHQFANYLTMACHSTIFASTKAESDRVACVPITRDYATKCHLFLAPKISWNQRGLIFCARQRLCMPMPPDRSKKKDASAT